MNRKRFKLPDGRYLYEVAPDSFQLQDVFQKPVRMLTNESVTLPSTIEPEQCPNTQELPQAL